MLLTVYIAAGVAFNKFRRGASGKELVPNLGFWTTLPGLVKVTTLKQIHQIKHSNQ